MSKMLRALISVYDKTGVVEFAKGLSERGVEIISTGGTAKLLKEKGVSVIEVSDYTGSPEILDGRLKTLHPKIHGGILAMRGNAKHQEQMKENGIEPIDMLVVNLYPFEETIAKPDCTFEEAVENIDIGGPTMVRAAAKNHNDVAVIVDPSDYSSVLVEMDSNENSLKGSTLFKLMKKAFATTASYDAAITNYFTALDDSKNELDMPTNLGMNFDLIQTLRYGENPHQQAAFYKCTHGIDKPSISDARQLQGKELSYNNIMDADAVLGMVLEFADMPYAAVVVKHANPCGAATSESSLSEALGKAIATDPLSAFGGIIGLNRSVDEAAAKIIVETFFEVVVAPSFDDAARVVLGKKKNLRLLELQGIGDVKSVSAGWYLRDIRNGILIQKRDVASEDVNAAEVVTKRSPSADELQALQFAWRICKHVKSNAIVFTSKDQALGVGAGQMSRVDAAKIAVMKSQSTLKGSVVASDAFFPFRDGVDAAVEAGATAIIQPGGSKRDGEVIAAADEHDVAMLFTGIRHFRH
ncbi:MAG: bifunctional phosphoribosylaminoimidazolecarboxamide formyltransferase/IMP cyclohydrolase [Deltaproteobacteria bacterium]|jgi:phosphoribosylaminoimidazolecarboxamide formyltransferase / IMP cyclohydrolase|nr:bifunctional phosphoribosylaminoimidazolecarboxamide formyltransferase/IMP cyclohydrolase [Deltaproteobacteria bacterium]